VVFFTAIATWIECPGRDFDRQGIVNVSLPEAFLVLPLVGALFIDILNAGTIKVFIQIIENFLT
jgi:Na+/glutamate symporter